MEQPQRPITPLNSLLDEIGFLFSGRGMPYEKVCMTVAMIISIFLSVLLSGNFAKDAPVAIIDLDNSRYSHELAARIDASEYMRVTDVINTPMKVMNPEYQKIREVPLNIKLRDSLGWRPEENFDTGIRKTIQWYLDNEWWWRPIREKKYSGERLGKEVK